MRYRIEDMPLDESMATTDDVYLFTVIMSLVIGIVLTWVGYKGRQIWLTVWCGGLVIASVVYLGYIAME